MYTVEFLKEAVAELDRVDLVWRRRILSKIKLLAENPQNLSNNIKRLRGKHQQYFRLRVGDFRVIYSEEKDKLLILIIRIGHRREVY